MASVYKSSADRKQKRNGIQVRVIEYKFKWIRGIGTYRLITTILDCEQAPADELAALQADDDPDRLSFKHTVQVIRRKIHLFRTFPPAALV
jgi:hypothetical protein